MNASQAPASEQYTNWLKFPNTFRKPTDEEWASEVDRLTAEISRLTENQLLQDSAMAAVKERAAELELDAGRYRWLKANAADIKFSDRHVVKVTMHYLDAAIDAARKEGA
jgi:hypothetical protein